MLFVKLVVVEYVKDEQFDVNEILSGGSSISQRRGRQPLRWDRQPIIWLKSSSKLHENERIWTQRGGGVPGAPLRSANENTLTYCIVFHTWEYFQCKKVLLRGRKRTYRPRRSKHSFSWWGWWVRCGGRVGGYPVLAKGEGRGTCLGWGYPLSLAEPGTGLVTGVGVTPPPGKNLGPDPRNRVKIVWISRRVNVE